MYVSIPPRFGVSAAAGAATVATQKTAPRPAAANPDFLIIPSLPLVVGMDRWRHPLPRFPAKHAGIQRRNAAARRKSAHLAAGHPVAGTHLPEFRADPTAALDRAPAPRREARGCRDAARCRTARRNPPTRRCGRDTSRLHADRDAAPPIDRGR